MTDGYLVSATMLNVLGTSAIIVATLCLGGTYYVENEIGRAVLLGSFAISLLNSILVFGFIRSRWIVQGDPDGGVIKTDETGQA